MALARPSTPPHVVYGHERPRIAPPVPARHDLKGFRTVASGMGIELMPWQEHSVRYLTATGPGDRLLFREVCIVVARQNGKTTLMKPLIVRALRAGKRIVHIAQNRELPRTMFGLIADTMANEPELFPKRRGRTIWPRYGSGQEEVILVNGGSYRIAAAGRGGARGQANDIVIIDELREMDSHEVIEASDPTLMMSADPQMIYLSNAGHDGSVVLNAVRERADKDSQLAYLEWSAAPERAVDDRTGWAEANPALGHYPSVQRELERAYTAHSLSGNLAIFETEHLCRWVATMRERLVDAYSWTRCADPELEAPRQPVMAVSMSPDGKRASVALAWQGPTAIGLRLLYNVPGDPIDIPALGEDIRRDVAKYGVRRVGFDPLTDAELVKYVKGGESITGRLYANASAQFVNIVNAGKLRWQDCDAVTDDLTWTARKAHDDTGHFEAVRATDDRSITAALAAIRAVWLASGPKPPAAKVM